MEKKTREVGLRANGALNEALAIQHLLDSTAIRPKLIS
jgi:hypothetical protein